MTADCKLRLIWGAALPIIGGHLRRGPARLKVGAHLLELRGLLLDNCQQGFHFLLLLGDGSLLPCIILF